MRDELLSMRLREKHRRVATLLAQRALLLEEYLEREIEEGRITLTLNPMHGQQAWLHGHCHQKAFDALSPAVRLLGRIPGLQTQLIEGSCCGMAGAFGYDIKTIGISKAMAEATLLPAVRAAKSDDWIVADGTSCRHQIHDGAQRQSVHVATLLACNLGLRDAPINLRSLPSGNGARAN
jgi:Fe-S oxidoreductase